jgi:hypothetical protein
MCMSKPTLRPTNKKILNTGRYNTPIRGSLAHVALSSAGPGKDPATLLGRVKGSIQISVYVEIKAVYLGG